MVADDQYPDAIGSDDAIQDRVRESMNDAAPELRLDDRKLQRIASDPRQHRVDFAPKFRIQFRTGTPIVSRSLVYIVYGRGMELNPHSAVPRVRRRNSSEVRAVTCPDSTAASRSRATAIPS